MGGSEGRPRWDGSGGDLGIAGDLAVAGKGRGRLRRDGSGGSLGIAGQGGGVRLRAGVYIRRWNEASGCWSCRQAHRQLEMYWKCL